MLLDTSRVLARCEAGERKLLSAHATAHEDGSEAVASTLACAIHAASVLGVVASELAGDIAHEPETYADHIREIAGDRETYDIAVAMLEKISVECEF